MKVQTITGKLNKFLFQTSNGWAIALFKAVDGSGQVKVKGQISLLQPKAVYELTGVFETHPKYGKNFDVSSFKLVELKTNDQYLSFFKEMVVGIGNVTGQKIVDLYQSDGELFQAILTHPEKLDTIKGLSLASKNSLIKEINLLLSESKLTNTFFNEGLKMDFLNHLKNHFSNKEEMIEKTLATNFYRYAKQNFLFPFSEVDKVAMHFQNLEPTSLVRLAWNLNHFLEEILQQTGNTYTSKAMLFRRFKDGLGIFDVELMEQALAKAIELKLIFEQSECYFSDESWNDELTISYEVIKRVGQQELVFNDQQLESMINQVEQEVGSDLKIANFKYDDQQRHVLKTFAEQNFLLLNGGPGTGKTTVLKGMVKLFELIKDFEKKPCRVAIAAPTGRAASRINEIDEHLNAKTIHKLLQATELGGFEISAANPLEFDLIIIDESSMIENKLFARLLEGSFLADKIVFIGDENQLPSVGYGEVFANLLAIDQIPKVNLKTVHRQQEGNGIIDLAYKILNNEINDLSDFNLPNITTNFGSYNQIDQINNLFATNLTTVDINNFQVITPFYKGSLGIDVINKNLQQVYQTQVLNKDLTVLTNRRFARKNQLFYVDDKVMYLVNDSSIGLSNGDVGKIETLVTSDGRLTKSQVVFNEEIKNFTTDNFNNLTLSYGCSVHKTQGSEYDSVIFVVEKNFNEFFLNKKLIYTAITRAKKHLYLVGDGQTLIKGIQKNALSRKTGLVGRMKAIFKREKGV